MSTGDLAHLELLAEIDALARRLEDWSRSAPPMAASRNVPSDYQPACGPPEFTACPPGITTRCRHIRGDGNGQELADQCPGGGRTGPHRSRPADDDPPGPALPPGADARSLRHGCQARSIWSSRIFPRWRTWSSSIAPTPIRPMPPGRDPDPEYRRAPGNRNGQCSRRVPGRRPTRRWPGCGGSCRCATS